MSSDTPALAIDNLGKAYRVFSRPADRLKQAFAFGRHQYFREHWALRGVSLQIERGEAVGILGRNGSGKSTLLQIIAGTLSPTEGSVTVRGRLAPLLELGSGFNLDFTGRENVFLNGAILGLTHDEIAARYNWIEQFADIGDYINEPVKTYSSGMFARLAFSVAAAVEPDILVVDEILSVGDIGFQQKCVAWMRQQRERGMTLLFVTHSPDAIRSLCTKALLLIDGKPTFWGAAEPAVDRYLEYVRIKANEEALREDDELQGTVVRSSQLKASHRYGAGHVQFTDIDLVDSAGQQCRATRFGDSIALRLTIRASVSVSNISLSFLVRDMTGVDLFGTTTFDERVSVPDLATGESATVVFRFSARMRAGNYGVSVAATRVSQRDYSDAVLLDQLDAALAFSVLADPARPVHYKVWEDIEVSLET